MNVNYIAQVKSITGVEESYDSKNLVGLKLSVENQVPVKKRSYSGEVTTEDKTISTTVYVPLSVDPPQVGDYLLITVQTTDAPTEEEE